MAATVAVRAAPKLRPQQQQRQQQSPDASTSSPGALTDASVATKKRSSSVFWIKLNFTVKAARLQSLKRQKYQHLQEETLLKARGLLKNWEDGPVLLIEDLYRRAAGEQDAQELMNYTPEALALRFSLRNDPAVLEAVKELWMIDTGPRDALGCIDQRGYTALFRRIAKSVDAEAFPKRRKREKTIHDDWKRDSKGGSQMSFADFFDSVFELADLWCETIESGEYVTFLTNVRDRISEKATTPGGTTKRVLRPMRKVKPLDEDESESSTSSSSEEEEEEEKEEEETTPYPCSESEAMAAQGVSQLHRFLTAKSLETGATNPRFQPAMTRKIHSATGLLGSQSRRVHSASASSRSDAAAKTPKLLSVSFQVQQLQKLQQRTRLEKRPSIVGTIRFTENAGSQNGRMARGRNSSASDLSALVEDAAFQPIGSPQTKTTSGNRLALENRRSGSGGSASGDIALDARPQTPTPTLAIHVVESGINGIFNSAAAMHTSSSTSSTAQTNSPGKSTLAPGTRNAIMSMARLSNGASKLLAGGRGAFQDAVFNAMHNSSKNSSNPHEMLTTAHLEGHQDGSYMGSIVGAQLHAGATTTSATTNSAKAASRDPSAALPKSLNHSPSSSTTIARPARTPVHESTLRAKPSLYSSNADEEHVFAASFPQPLAANGGEEASSTASQGYAASGRNSTSEYTAATAPWSSPSNPNTTRKRDQAAPASSQRKRVLPPMSPIQQQQQHTSLYQFEPVSLGEHNANVNSGAPPDFTTSYTMKGYATDPTKTALSHNNVASANASISSLDPNVTSGGATSTPLWYGLKPMRERRKAPKQLRVKPPIAQKPLRDTQLPPSRQQQNATSVDEFLLHASPWDTSPDDDDDLNRDWQSFSIAETSNEEGSAFGNSDPSPGKSSHKKEKRSQTDNAKQHGGRDGSASSSTGSRRFDLALRVTSMSGATATGSGTSTTQLHHSHSVPETATIGDGARDLGILSNSASSVIILSKPPHSQQHLPRSVSREQKGVTGWKDSSIAPIDTLTGLKMRCEATSLTPSWKYSPDCDELLGGATRILRLSSSPLKHHGGGGGCGCSRRSDKLRPSCCVEHREASRMRSQTASSPYYDDDVPKSPVFRIEKHDRRLDRDGGCEDRPELPPEKDDVTILMNAHRELVFRPTRKEDDVVEGASKQLPTRSEMMKRRYKYTFGKEKS